MRTRRFFIALLAIAGLAACQEPEEVITPNEPARYDLTATIAAAGDLTWSWASNDNITVYDGKDVNAFITTESGESVVFSGLANKNAEELMAIYPSTTEGRYFGKVNKVLPVAQAGVKDGVDKSSLILAAYKKNDGQNTLNFKNMTAFVKVNVVCDDQDVVALELKSNAGEPLAGNVKVGLFEELTIEAAEGASASVTLSDDPFSGVYYFSVIPQTLTEGYTFNLVASDDSRGTITTTEEVTFTKGEITELTVDFNNVEWVAPVNPNPTAVPSVAVVKATFEEAPFNMVSEGSFEYLPDQDIRYRTPWFIESPWHSSVTGHDGSPTLLIDLDAPFEERQGWHRIVQVCALRQHTNFVHSAWTTRTHPNTYFNCCTWPFTFRNQELGGAHTWGTATEWEFITHTVNTGDDFGSDVIAGAWWEPGMKVQYDEITIIPEGYTAKSTAPKSQEKLGGLSNATFDQIEDLGKIVAWKNSKGELCFILSDFTVKGIHYDTAVAFTECTDITKPVVLSRLLKKRGQFTPIALPDNSLSIVPNDVFILNGKTYLHYFAKKWQNPDNADDWTVDHAGFLVSEDDGITWTQCSTKWRGDGTFCSASFAEKDGMLYMLGTNSGRKLYHAVHEFHRSNFYVARISTTEDFTDPDNWEYFNCKEWHKNGEPVYTDDGFDPNRLVMGSRGECALIWNPKFERFMMIYRDGRQEGLVYRDAASVDDVWSGEKPLAYDDLAAGIYAPSVIDITADGEVILVASQL